MLQHKSTPDKDCHVCMKHKWCFSYFCTEGSEMLANNSLELNQPFSRPTSTLSIQPGYQCFAIGAVMQGAG